MHYNVSIGYIDSEGTPTLDEMVIEANSPEGAESKAIFEVGVNRKAKKVFPAKAIEIKRKRY